MGENYYQIIGVSKNSSQEEIDEQYRFNMQAFHPDKFQDERSKKIAEEKAKLINKAYSVLKNPQTRRQYDLEIGYSESNPKDTGKPRYEYKKPEQNGTQYEKREDEKEKGHSSTSHEQTQQTTTNDLRCQSCHQKRKLEQVSFSSVYSIFFWIRIRSIKGYLCANCAIECFWKFTALTLLFGWWGFGIITMPFFIVSNLISHNKTRIIRKKVNHRINIALNWKLLCFGILLIIICFVPFLLNNDQMTEIDIPLPSQENDNIKVLTESTKQPTRISYSDWVGTYEVEKELNRPPQETTRKPDCSHWGTISIYDAGKTKCVFGEVYDSYIGGDIFYIRFSKEPNSFRFIVLNNYYFKDINGRCIKATGEVKTFGDLSYIELGDTIQFCD